MLIYTEIIDGVMAANVMARMYGNVHLVSMVKPRTDKRRNKTAKAKLIIPTPESYESPCLQGPDRQRCSRGADKAYLRYMERRRIFKDYYRASARDELTNWEDPFARERIL